MTRLHWTIRVTDVVLMIGLQVWPLSLQAGTWDVNHVSDGPVGPELVDGGPTQPLQTAEMTRLRPRMKLAIA